MRKSFFFVLFLASLISVFSQVERDEIDDVYKWNLTDLYSSDESWNEAKEALKPKLELADTFKGTLTSSAKQLLEALEFDSNFKIEVLKVYLYASLKAEIDMRDMKNQSLLQEVEQIWVDYNTSTVFVRPEILSAEWKLIHGFMETEPGLEPYEKMLQDMFRMKGHILEEEEGRIFSLSDMLSFVPGSVHSIFINAEMPNPEVTLSNGEEITLSLAGYQKNRAGTNRDDRALVFRTFFENLEKFQATLGELLHGGVKKDVFQSKALHYNTSLEAALDQNNIPIEVYLALVENVNNNLSAFHRYLELKKRLMGLDTLKYIDLNAPAVKDINLSYGFSEARELMINALAPLGKEYVSVIERAFNERWIDVYPSTGKKSGAYTIPLDYHGHPYILLNYNGSYDDVSTVAHELGHAMHSYYSTREQPFPTSHYPAFTAEVAANLNEVLLFYYVLKQVQDDENKLSLLMQWLDLYKLMLFRQTQLAEFELEIHRAVEKGIPLTGEYLSDLYLNIAKKYFGHDQGVCLVDDFMHMGWATNSLFYYNYYLFQYSTSFTASISLAKSVLDQDEGARDRYLAFLAAGDSDYPIALLKKAGVDMTGSGVFNSTISAMTEVMDEIERILDKE